jgi:hypothetical protein
MGPESNRSTISNCDYMVLMKGAIFRVHTTTLQKPKRYGGWGSIDIAAKCIALLLSRKHSQYHKAHQVTAQWLQSWQLHVQPSNPSKMQNIPASLPYLREYASIMAYVTPPEPLHQPVISFDTSTRPCISWRHSNMNHRRCALNNCSPTVRGRSYGSIGIQYGHRMK